MTSTIEREVLIDVLHNRGASPEQVRYRLIDHSPLTVHRTIERLISIGHLSYYGTIGKLEITKAGMDALYLKAVPV